MALLAEGSPDWAGFVRLAFDRLEDDLASGTADPHRPHDVRIRRPELDAYIDEGGVPQLRRVVDVDAPGPGAALPAERAVVTGR